MPLPTVCSDRGQDGLICTKSSYSFQELVRKAEEDLAFLDHDLIDDAADAVILGSDLELGLEEDFLALDMGSPDPEAAASGSQDVAPDALRPSKRKRDLIETFDSAAAEVLSVSSSPNSEEAAGSLDHSPSSRQQRRNRRRRRSRKAKAPAILSKRRALYRKAELIASNLTPTSLPHSAQGYMGSAKSAAAPVNRPRSDEASSSGSLPSSVDDRSHPRLLQLIQSGYRLVDSSGGAALFLDCENRIIGWRTGIVGGNANEAHWDSQNADLSTALEKLAQNIPSHTGVSRGEHSWAHWGYSYGGGERKPCNRQQTKTERAYWEDLLKQPAYVEATQAVTDSWKTWAPHVHRDYEDCHRGILERQPSLDLVYPQNADEALPFASLTANLGPRTVCKSHRDIKNRANGGVCAIKTLGRYNSRHGGHIVLHELGLIIEMRPGDVIFFPSAVITHETIPIAPDENRYSLVWYSAAGLFRWRDANFRSFRSWKQQDAKSYGTHQKMGEARWTGGWQNFSTLADLVAQAPVR